MKKLIVQDNLLIGAAAAVPSPRNKLLCTLVYHHPNLGSIAFLEVFAGDHR